MQIFRYIAAVAIAVACLLPSVGSAQTSLYAPETSIRSTAVLTASDVLSTTFTIPSDAKAVHFYIDFTKGSLTSADFSPAGAMSGDPASTGYFKSAGKTQTFTASGRFHIRVLREDFGAYKYGGIYTLGTGTATSSDALIKVKFEI